MLIKMQRVKERLKLAVNSPEQDNDNVKMEVSEAVQWLRDTQSSTKAHTDSTKLMCVWDVCGMWGGGLRQSTSRQERRRSRGELDAVLN